MDKHLLLLLNFDGGAVLDGISRVLSSPLIWIVPAVLFLSHLFKTYPRGKALALVLCMVLTIVLCDQISASVIKPMFQRLRPSHCPSLVGMLHFVGDYRGGMYGFVSSHAANAFGVVTFVSLVLRRRWVTIALYALAASVGYSRIYLGVHYPGDVLAGALLGSGIGYGVYRYCPVTYVVMGRYAPRYVLGLFVLLLAMVWHRQTDTNVWARSSYRNEK